MGAKLRAIKRRRKAVLTTQQITRAMELIAASRIIRAQNRAEAARPYGGAIGEMVEMVSSEAKESPLLAEREIRNTGLLVMTSDRGLCGAYNSNVIREAERARARETSLGREVRVTSVGKRGGGYFSFRKVHLSGEFTGVSDRPTFSNAKEISEQLVEQYRGGELDQLLFAYTDFVSMALQRARVAQILPVVRKETESQGPESSFDFEPEPSELLETLLPRYVEVKIFAALLESSASEHAARRRAMKDATDNATDLLKVLKRDEDRARQAEITAEIADLVGAAEAMN